MGLAYYEKLSRIPNPAPKAGSEASLLPLGEG